MRVRYSRIYGRLRATVAWRRSHVFVLATAEYNRHYRIRYSYARIARSGPCSHHFVSRLPAIADSPRPPITVTTNVTGPYLLPQLCIGLQLHSDLVYYTVQATARTYTRAAGRRKDVPCHRAPACTTFSIIHKVIRRTGSGREKPPRLHLRSAL